MYIFNIVQVWNIFCKFCLLVQRLNLDSLKIFNIKYINIQKNVIFGKNFILKDFYLKMDFIDFYSLLG